MNNKEFEEIKDFIFYLEDKVEDCYQQEVKQAIEEFLQEIKKGVVR